MAMCSSSTLAPSLASATMMRERISSSETGCLVIPRSRAAFSANSSINGSGMGVQVWSFKTPSAEELDHGYLWRCMKCAPGRGRIGIFNRSYYEEVLVVRLHPQMLESQKLPKPLVTKHIWQERFEDINNFERYLTRNGIAVV